MTAFVGLTGGIASGKSTVARLFREEGIGVVDADAVAREIVLPGSPGLEAIVEAFGREILGPDGTLDRKALGERIFSDVSARRTLEAITHPRIFARSMELLGEFARREDVYAIYEAALLVENGSYRMFQALVVVAARRETQLWRMIARDGMSRAAAEARLDAQLPVERKVEVADHVIWNDEGEAELAAKVKDVHLALVRRFAEKVSER